LRAAGVVGLVEGLSEAAKTSYERQETAEAKYRPEPPDGKGWTDINPATGKMYIDPHLNPSSQYNSETSDNLHGLTIDIAKEVFVPGPEDVAEKMICR